MKLLLAVLLAHLLGDFPLQSSSMVRAKHQGSRAYLAHGAIHLLVLVLCVAVFVSLQWLTSLWFWIMAALYIAVHLGIDRAFNQSTFPTLGGEVISPLAGRNIRWSWPDCHLPSYPKESAGDLHLWLQA